MRHGMAAINQWWWQVGQVDKHKVEMRCAQFTCPASVSLQQPGLGEKAPPAPVVAAC